MRRFIPLHALAFLFSALLGTSRGEDVEIARLPLQLIDDIEIATLDPGIVDKMEVKVGDSVRQGDVLFRLDSDIFEADVAAQEANYLAAFADAEDDVHIRYSEKSLALNEAILEKNEIAIAEYARSVSQTELGKLRLERDQAALGLEKAEAERKKASLVAGMRAAELAAAKIRLSRRSVKAPCDGVVVKIETQVGEAVSNGQVVVRMVNLDTLRLIASVDLELRSRFSVETKGRFECDKNGEQISMPATVVFVSPEIRYTEQTFDVWLEVENSEGKLMPGMKGTLVLSELNESDQSPSRLLSANEAH